MYSIVRVIPTPTPPIVDLNQLRMMSRQGSESGSLSESLKDGVGLGAWCNTQGYWFHALLGNEIWKQPMGGSQITGCSQCSLSQLLVGSFATD